MTPEEQKSFIAALQGKNYIFVRFIKRQGPPGLPKVELSEWMTKQEALQSKYWTPASEWYLNDRNTAMQSGYI